MLVFHHLSRERQDWTKTNWSGACLYLPARMDKDEYSRKSQIFFSLSDQTNDLIHILFVTSVVMFDRDLKHHYAYQGERFSLCRTGLRISLNPESVSILTVKSRRIFLQLPCKYLQLGARKTKEI